MKAEKTIAIFRKVDSAFEYIFFPATLKYTNNFQWICEKSNVLLINSNKKTEILFDDPSAFFVNANRFCVRTVCAFNLLFVCVYQCKIFGSDIKSTKHFWYTLTRRQFPILFSFIVLNFSNIYFFLAEVRSYGNFFRFKNKVCGELTKTIFELMRCFFF